MSSHEVMVVLSDAGKPVTVIRALDNDDDDVIGRGQRSPSSAGGARPPPTDPLRTNATARYSVTSPLRPREGANYCDEYVGLSVCLFVRDGSNCRSGQ